MAIPVPVERWFASQYPSLRFNPEWLQGCYDYLQANFNYDTPTLIKEMNNQLLLSDLGDSTLQHPGLLPAAEGETEGEGEGEDRLFVHPKSAVLVQVLEVIDIGHSALSLLDRHKARMEDKKILRATGREHRRPIMTIDNTQRDQNDEGNDEGGAQAIASTKGFPRSMLRLRVSDGFTEYVALEAKRIAGLSMDETPLGTKLLLKSVRCLRGHLMLDTESCVIKGGQIVDLEQKRDQLLQEVLKRRIEGTYGDDQDGEPGGDVRAAPPSPRDPRQAPQNRPVRPPSFANQPSTTRRPPPVQQKQQQRQSEVDRNSTTIVIPSSDDAVALRDANRRDDEFDELLDDDDMDDLDVAMLIADEPSGAAPAPRCTQKVVDDTEDEALWASVESPPRAGPSRTEASQRVIDIDDSEDEVERALLQRRQPQQPQQPQRKRRQPVVIDIDD